MERDPEPQDVLLESAPKDRVHDPVLAQHPERFAYVHRPARKIIRYGAAVVGLFALFVGAGRLIEDDGSSPVGIGATVVGLILIVPAFLGLRRRGAAHWHRRHENGQAEPLFSAVLDVDADEERASEIVRILRTEKAARRWPILDTPRGEGDLRAGVHWGEDRERPVITLWKPTDDGARCWPLIEPDASHVDEWLDRVFPKGSTDTESSYIQRLTD